jgi:hypothetical protein
MLDGIADHLSVDVETLGKRGDHGVDVRHSDIGDEVYILRRSWNSVERTGNGTAHHVTNPEGIEDARELRHDEDGFREHQ